MPGASRRLAGLSGISPTMTSDADASFIDLKPSFQSLHQLRHLKQLLSPLRG
jgi:hypothetical protein